MTQVLSVGASNGLDMDCLSCLFTGLAVKLTEPCADMKSEPFEEKSCENLAPQWESMLVQI